MTFTFGEDVPAGDAVTIHKTNGKIYKADASDLDLLPAIGFAPNAVTVDNTGKVRWFGWIDVDTSFAAGDDVRITVARQGGGGDDGGSGGGEG